MIFSSIEADLKDPVIRLIRRVCVLREQGDEAEAKAIEATRLPSAIHDARAALGAGALPDDELEKIFSTEKNRAAEAVAVAQILIRQLTTHWAEGASRGSRTPVVPPVQSAPRRPEPPEKPAGSPAIPDLLDAMFARESAARRA